METMWRELLSEALTKPGAMPEVHSKYRNYSLGNRLWLWTQLINREMPISPVASYNQWKERGRQVKKGEKALSMTMPRVAKKKSVGEEDESILLGFMVKRYWFSLEQTEGDDYVPDVLFGKWETDKALTALGIREETFCSLNPDCMGYAKPKEMIIAVNPCCDEPWMSRFHEIAHCLLHKEGAQVLSDDKQIGRAIQEVEAELVAYLCCSSLDLPGALRSRSYIQGWLLDFGSEEFSEKNIQRVFGAADRILSSGICKEVK